MSESCNLIGSGGGQNSPILPAHDRTPRGPESAGNLLVKLFFSGATKRWIFTVEMEGFTQYTQLETVVKTSLSHMRLDVVFCVLSLNLLVVLLSLQR